MKNSASSVLGGRLARAATLALGATIPISVALDGLFAYLLVPVGWLLEANYAEKCRRIIANPVARAALMLFGLLLISSIWSMGSGRDIGNGLSKYKALVYMALLMPVLQHPVARARAWRFWIGSMLLILVLSLLIWGHMLPAPNRILTGDAFSPTVFKQRITQNLFMAYAAFFLALQARAAAGGKRLLLALLTLLAAADVILVPGRTGWVALAVLTVYYLVNWLRWRGVLFAALALAVLTVGGWYGSKGFHARLDETQHSFETWQPGVASETSDGERLEFWRTTLRIIRSHPVLGVGVGGFDAAYAQAVAGTDIPVSHNPHNQYLLELAQLGPLGLAALLWLFWTMWRQAAKLDRRDAALARGLVLAMASGCLANSFLIDHAESFFFAWSAALLFCERPRRAESAD